ncbi:MAG: carbamate kinase [Proteobacteria bacterium]|nr:carbamate kinase [Pseudomonadota bacterium]
MTQGNRTAVVAVGGNSLITDEFHQAIPDQYEAAVNTVKRVVDMMQSGWNIVLTHGSGPQVGYILRRSELAIAEVAPVPMDYADADIQGAVGYMFQRAFHNEFVKRGLPGHAIAIVSQVLVDPDDPAFANPTKPIGPQLDEATAKARGEKLGWIVKDDVGRGWRRVVPSPTPRKILELEQIKLLTANGFVVIACGGGGIPVIENEKKYLVGVEAVVDKDLASSLLASDLKADVFIITTGVDRVAINYGAPNEEWLDSLDLNRARELYDADHFDPGSMGPKVLAMINYLESGGAKGIITNPENLIKALDDKSGTRFFSR